MAKMHLARSFERYGQTFLGSLCGQIKNAQRGADNLTDDEARVTCKCCTQRVRQSRSANVHAPLTFVDIDRPRRARGRPEPCFDLEGIF